MKKIFTLTGIAALILASCDPDPVIYDPLADFSANNNLVVPTEVVFFTNNSLHGEYFEWDFDDGYTSTDINPSHYFSNEGVYEVRLAAYNHGKVDYAYLSIEVYETTLEITVQEYTTGDYIPYAEVTLYYSLSDWQNFQDPIKTANADRYGVVVFKNLETIPYYVDAWDSFSGANNDFFYDPEYPNETIGFIETLPLEHAHYNTFTVMVDYPENVPNNGIIKSTTEKRSRGTNFSGKIRKFSDEPLYKLKK